MPSIQTLLYGPIGARKTILIVVFALWSLLWKGLSLWKSARNEQKIWYIVLLILNTAGILDIVYLAFFQRAKKKNTKKK